MCHSVGGKRLPGCWGKQRGKPANEEALRRVRGLEWKAGGGSSTAVLAMVREALALPEDQRSRLQELSGRAVRKALLLP